MTYLLKTPVNTTIIIKFVQFKIIKIIKTIVNVSELVKFFHENVTFHLLSFEI